MFFIFYFQFYKKKYFDDWIRISRVWEFKSRCKINLFTTISLINKHILLFLVLSIANDIWLAIRIGLYKSLFDPVIDERGGSLVSLCSLIHLLQLSLKNLNMLILISYLGCISFAICLNDIFELKLCLHINLSSSPSTSRLKNMNTSSLGSFKNKWQDWKVKAFDSA